MPDEHEIQWQSYQGVEYELWEAREAQGPYDVKLVTKIGDGSLQSHVVPATNPRRFYKLIQGFSGKEPLGLRATVAWDGTYVLLDWPLIAKESPMPSLQLHVVRDGNTIAQLPLSSTSYRHNNPGTGIHIYSVAIGAPI